MTTDHCPHCDAPLEAQETAEGRCRSCGKEITPHVNPDAAGVQAASEIPTLRAYDGPRGERPRKSPPPRPAGSGIRCPECGSGSSRAGPWPWYLGTVGAMVCRAVICNDCGHEFDANKPHANLAARKRNLAIVINGIGLLGMLAIFGALVLWIWFVFTRMR
jgi:DNA-directed RNA polymerase subunit RPC12/RpoP